MKFQLKPRIFLIGFLPGFLFIAGFVTLYNQYDLESIKSFAQNITLFTGTGIVILSFIIGQVFDSFRDFFLEYLIFRSILKILNWKDINWNFWYESSNQNIDKLDNNYFLFYIINLNISISLIALIIIGSKIHNTIPYAFLFTKIQILWWEL